MEGGPLFSFGVASDIQYADKDVGEEIKFYREGIARFDECVQEWNKYSKNHTPLEFTIHLGDIIDGNKTVEQTKKELDEILQVFSKNEHKHYHVVGNHCLKLPRDYLVQKLKLESEYYDFVVKEKYRFIILDGTDISVYGWPESSENYNQAQNWLSNHNIEEFPNAVRWNSAVGKKQMEWLRNKLDESKKLGQKVFIINHYPIVANVPTHLLWNWQELLSLIEDKEYEGMILAYLNGHFHPGCFEKKGKTYFWCVKGILEAPFGSNCFAIVHVYEDKIEIQGFGTEESRILPL